ncbi:MAG TPA: hypothetical protein DCS97_07020 [Planctomycetes bacterium]|nr:hypothetical protein [Planctomycetota bacterium]
MSAQGVRAGRAYVELFADGKQLTAGLKKAQAQLRAFGDGMRQAGQTLAIAGGAAMAPFVLSIKGFLDAAKAGKLAGADLGKAITLATDIRSTTESVDRLKIAVGSALTPVLLTAASALRGMVDGMTAWARSNPGTVALLGVTTTGIAGLGIALLVAGTAVKAMSFAVGGLAIAWGKAMSIMGGTVALFTSPLAIATAAVAGIGYVLATQTEQGRADLTYLGEGFDKVKGDAITAWNGIGDAMAAGDLGLAAAIGLRVVKIEFTRAWSFLKELTLGFLVGINKAFMTIGASIAAGWINTMGSIKSVLAEAGHGIKGWYKEWVGKESVKIANAYEMLGVLPAGTTAATQANADDINSANTNAKQAALNDLARSTQQQLASITEQAAELRDALNVGLAEVITENDSVIDGMRARLDELRQSAANARATLESDMQKKGEAAQRAAESVSSLAPKADVLGTFSTAATFGLGIGNSTAERTAKAAEQSAEELKKIREKIYTGETTFAP